MSRGTTQRVVKENPATGEFEVQHVTTPDVYRQGKASASTLMRGLENKPDHMVSKGKGGAKPNSGGAR